MIGSTPQDARASGFTLIEVMVAATLLMVGVLGTFTMVDGAQRTTRSNTGRTNALNLAREILEQARSLDYDRLNPTELVAQLRAKPGLQGAMGSNGNWVITRRGIAMTVTVQVCTFDDPMDGLAATPPSNPCAAATAVPGAPIETNPDDFRRVSLRFDWESGGVPQSATQSGMVANPSGGIGPRVVSLPDPFQLQVTAAVNIPFVVNTTAAASVRWSMDDGIHMGDATGGPSIWGFNWDLGTVGVGSWTVDGTYTASVQPFDARGVPGEARMATVALNRRVPLAPTKVTGGRSEYGGGVMELEWAQNPERDVLGYRVYRLGLSSKTRVCPASTAGTDAVITKTTCTDSAPNTLGLYQVVAVDRPTLGNPASGTREGDTTNFVATNLGTRPAAPAGLTASIVDGRVRLQWSGLAVPPLFYRIYRNGTRIDRTATPEPFYVDGEPFDGVARTYQVSAVGLTFNESTLSAAVTIG